MATLTPMRAIRKKCLECSNNQWKEVELCPIGYCSLYSYRFGKRPETVARKKSKHAEVNRIE